MRKSLKFSIITCTWNSEKFIQQCIDSVLGQDYPYIEYILVDGGSTDKTLDYIKAIGRPTHLITNIQGGISKAMNKGIELATGDIIAHLHSDDYYLLPSVLGEIAKIFEETDAGWVFGKNMRDQGEGPKPEKWIVPRYSYQRLLKGNFIPHESTFVRRQLLIDAGMFSTVWKYGMDYDMWLKLGKLSKPVQLDLAIGVFREHPNSYSTANADAAFEEDWHIRMNHLGWSPATWIYHYAHYLVRKQRRRRSVSGEDATTTL